MDNNLNSYGYQEENYLYTWREETHDWRKHNHKHLEDVKNTIINQVKESQNIITTAITNSTETISNKIDGVQNYIENNIEPKVDVINTVNDGVNKIWNKIQTWNINQ